MKKISNIFWLLCIYQSLGAQSSDILICEEKKGCTITNIYLPPADLSLLQQKGSGRLSISKDSILVLNGCESFAVSKKQTDSIHKKFGGSGKPVVKRSFSLRLYLAEKKCIACPNNTKKISFRVRTPEFTGSSWFYANLQSGEAYMPNAAHQQLYGPEAAGVTVDAFFRDYQHVSYMIDPEGRKWMVNMPIGTSIGTIGSADSFNEKYFKQHFKATGKKRKHLDTNLEQVAYSGSTEEGPITFWLAPTTDVCLMPGKFSAWGFFNLGWIAVDGITYAVTGIEGKDFTIEMTGISEGHYQFNAAGYTPVSSMIP